jgi:hypothetical protein
MALDPSSACTLASFTLQLSTTQSAHNRHAHKIFTAHFIQAVHATLYSLRCISGALFTEAKVSKAFDHALTIQMRLQMLSAKDEAYQVIHRQEYRDAVKIGVSCICLINCVADAL